MHVAGINLAHGQGHHPFSSLPTRLGAGHSWTKLSYSHPHILEQVALNEAGQAFKRSATAKNCSWRTIAPQPDTPFLKEKENTRPMAQA